MKIESTLNAPNWNTFLQARKDKNITEPTEQGLKQAGELLAQYGSERKVVVAGEVAVALKEQTFDEMVQKFGEAKQVKEGIYTFNAAGSDLVANWYKTVMEDEGYGAADRNKDGLISNHESFATKRMIGFDAQGRVFLDQPHKGDIQDNDSIYISLNDAVERDISSDTNKDGVISSSEVKAKEGLNIDKLREETMVAKGMKFDLSELLDGYAGEGKEDAASLRGKLQELERQIGELRSQGADNPKLKELQAMEQQLLRQLAQLEDYRPVSEKA